MGCSFTFSFYFVACRRLCRSDKSGCYVVNLAIALFVFCC
uniref:Uncharacterized protein n=1 Tax=Rhizophora mucronata TaxID=61149 RepID=A0A2P2PFM3_RHIMU